MDPRASDVIVTDRVEVTTVTIDGDPSDPALMEQEIEATRAEMSETIEAIQQRLDPEVVSEQAKDVARYASEEAKEVVKYAIDEAKSAVRELADQATASLRDATIGRAQKMTSQARGSAQQVQGGLLSTIKSNPLPAALVAAGVGWMWSQRGGSSGSERPHYDYASRRPNADWSGAGMESMKYATSDTSRFAAGGYGSASGYGYSDTDSSQQHQASDVGQMAGQVQERAGEFKGQVQQQAGQVQQQAQGLWQMIESNPVAMGAAGLLLGGIAALLIPETEQEQKLLGESRDRVIGSVQQVAGQTVEKVQRIAEEAGQAAMDEAKSQGVVPKESGSSASA